MVNTLFQHLVTSPTFEYVIFGAILINTISLAMGFYHQPQVRLWIYLYQFQWLKIFNHLWYIRCHWIYYLFHYAFQVYTDMLDILNYIFTAFFAMEFCLKMAAFRPKVKFCMSWSIKELFEHIHILYFSNHYQM